MVFNFTCTDNRNFLNQITKMNFTEVNAVIFRDALVLHVEIQHNFLISSSHV